MGWSSGGDGDSVDGGRGGMGTILFLLQLLRRRR